jgi:hypothetical protein
VSVRRSSHHGNNGRDRATYLRLPVYLIVKIKKIQGKYRGVVRTPRYNYRGSTKPRNLPAGLSYRSPRVREV